MLSIVKFLLSFIYRIILKDRRAVKPNRLAFMIIVFGYLVENSKISISVLCFIPSPLS
jgi:hypothetical protein